MSIAQIKAFSEQAKTDPELKEKLLAVQKIRELISLGKEYNFEFFTFTPFKVKNRRIYAGSNTHH